MSPEEIFQLHPKLRWTAFSTDAGKIVFSQMRSGLVSYTDERQDMAFMEFGPQLLTGIAERLSLEGGAGNIQSLIINMEKDSVLLTKARGGYLATSADRKDALLIFNEVEGKIRQLCS
ncbi:MAG TPA: hypothetical protein VLV18_04380 [Terriglobales bacterium]|nr:hypothetical protein [Terriglobales bacterium]